MNVIYYEKIPKIDQFTGCAAKINLEKPCSSQKPAVRKIPAIKGNLLFLLGQKKQENTFRMNIIKEFLTLKHFSID